MKYHKIILLTLFFVLSTNASAQAVYISKTGEKYHTINCKYLKYSKNEITLKKAESLGYLPCQVCKPIAKSKNSSTKTSHSTSGSKKITSTKKRATAVQCKGTTSAGNRCKRRTNNSSGRCFQH